MTIPDSINSLKKNGVLNEYNYLTRKKILFVAGLVLVIVLMGMFSITLGPLKMSFFEVFSTFFSKFFPGTFSAPNEFAEMIVWNVRLPRFLMGFAAGFSLAISGAVMQPVLKNPLASPYTLGISSGAGFGAAIAIIYGKSIGIGSYFVVANAFLFALLTSILIIKSWDLNVMSAGDEVAKSLGINVERTRFLLIVVTSLLTATVICFTGAIGFIGLLAPHVTRMIIGGDNRFVVPASGFIGAVFLVGADIIAMNIMSPVILPIGVMTSFMGVPLFIYLIVKRRRGSW